MEYVEGPRLSDLLRDGPLPSERAVKLILQVCAALRYAHKRGVVHRDLKPSNLLIRQREDGEEQLKVVDFGLVKLTEADQSITRAGLILGSPHCMAPEQVKGLEVDHRADVYAVGVLVFRCLTGQYPFHGPNSAATMIAHLNLPIPTFFSVAPDLVAPAGLEEIVRKCLSKSPSDRYSDMQALMDDLALCLNVPPEQFRSVSQSHSTIQKQLSPPRSRSGLMVAVALLFMLAVVSIVTVSVAVWWARAPGDEPVVADIVQPEPVPPPAPIVVPVPAPVVEPVVQAGTADGTDPAGTASAEPVLADPPVEPAPAPVAPKPRPRPKPAPVAVAPEPAPAPAPEPKPDGPEGYMGLPEDLFK